MGPSQSTRAIILRSRLYADSDKIVTFFSEQVGKLTGIAKGARNSRRRFANCLDPFTTVRVHFKTRANASLVFMESCDLLRPPGPLADPVKLAYGSYLVELVDMLTAEAQPIHGVFDLLTEALEELRSGAATDCFLRSYEMQLLQHTGFHPQLDGCAQCGRSLAADEACLLDSRHGRVLGAECGGGSADLMPVRGATLTLLRSLRQLSLPEARRTRIDDVSANEASILLGHLLALHLPRPLRSARLIRSLTQ